MPALTFDTGALIALTRGDKRMRTVLVAAQERRAVITVPTPPADENRCNDWIPAFAGMTGWFFRAICARALLERCA